MLLGRNIQKMDVFGNSNKFYKLLSRSTDCDVEKAITSARQSYPRHLGWDLTCHARNLVFKLTGFGVLRLLCNVTKKVNTSLGVYVAPVYSRGIMALSRQGQ